ncbi:MAG TPA: hypothetical protein VG323_18275 [Thermoanaerobaculia bacterium]|nr:hypothetical protein [Thermoanaerobaculia bacterium]
MTKVLSAAEVAQNFQAVLNGIAESSDEVLVEQGGQVVARLVPYGSADEITLESMRGRLEIVGDHTLPPIKKVSVAEFVQNCASFIDAALNDGDVIVIEKDGQTVARVAAEGPMYGTVRYEGDILSPVADPDDWTADEDNIFGTPTLDRV